MNERENFSSRLGFVLVSAGCAIGLGNVWKFPYICGANGGAAFILIYLAFLLLLGLPILICEFAIGRGSNRSVAECFEKLQPKGTKWKHFKWVCIAGNYILMMFYTMVGGWMLYYTYKAISGGLEGLDTQGTAQAFGNMLNEPWTMVLWTVIVIALSFGVCILGVRKGVEKITKVMMLLLIFLMAVLAINSLCLSGAEKGVQFYLVPDFQKMNENGIGNVVFAAMTHAFFTLSVGIGSMSIMGSYLDRKKTITGAAINVVVLDTVIALVAGLIIIPACFAYGIEPDSGPSLLFITLPNVFNNMAGGRIWSSLFFVFMSFAAISTIIAVFENIVAINIELFNIKRSKSVFINMGIIVVLSVITIFGYNYFSGFQPFGEGSTIMDLEDFILSYNILPLGCLIFVLFCSAKSGWGFDNFISEVNSGKGMKFPSVMKNYIRFILPIIIIVVYLKGYDDMFAKYDLTVRIIMLALAVAMLAATILISGVFKKPKNRLSA